MFRWSTSRRSWPTCTWTISLVTSSIWRRPIRKLHSRSTIMQNTISMTNVNLAWWRHGKCCFASSWRRLLTELSSFKSSGADAKKGDAPPAADVSSTDHVTYKLFHRPEQAKFSSNAKVCLHSTFYANIDESWIVCVWLGCWLRTKVGTSRVDGRNYSWQDGATYNEYWKWSCIAVHSDIFCCSRRWQWTLRTRVLL